MINRAYSDIDDEATFDASAKRTGYVLHRALVATIWNYAMFCSPGKPLLVKLFQCSQYSLFNYIRSHNSPCWNLGEGGTYGNVEVVKVI